MDLSIVIPLYNEDESLGELHDWIVKVVDKENYTYEIIFVDDGSKDKSWEVISDLSEKNPNVKGIHFRRNYGKSPALYCGFNKTSGDVVITMDADLQDSPDEIPELYRLIKEEGNDIVSGWKKKRYDPITKTAPSKFFNWTARKISGIQLNDFNCGLKSYNSKVVKSIEVYGDMHRYIPILAKDAGFSKIIEKPVEHRSRKYGTTKFGIERFLHGFLDLLSISFISKFGKRPMHFFGLWGSLLFFAGTICSIIIGIRKINFLLNGERAPLVTDSPYFYISLVCMVIGAQLFLAGFLGELISRSSSERNKNLIDDSIK